MNNRVVITGLGVVAPNGVGIDQFTNAIQNGKSGIQFHQHLKDKGFSCCIGGIPEISEEKISEYLSPLQLRGFNSTSILYGCMAAIDAWKDAGFLVNENTNLDYDSGLIFGTGTSGIEKFRESIYKIDAQHVRRLGSTSVVQTMASGISAYLGGILGFAIESNYPDRFGSEMLVEPNFKSVRQLYYNINFYNDLVKQKDTLTLTKTFNLSKNEAASLKKFSIEPIVNRNDIIDAYDEFIIRVDTATVSTYTFEDFKPEFKELDYKTHKIVVESEKNSIFKKLSSTIILSVVKNSYFKRVKNLTNENLNRTDSVYRQNLSQIDSLRKVYMKVMIAEAGKETSGTNIDLGGQQRRAKELDLFETSIKINEELEEISKERSEKHDIINIISDFQPVGYKINGVTKNYIFILGALGFGLMVAILLLFKLNIYLENYKK